MWPTRTQNLKSQAVAEILHGIKILKRVSHQLTLTTPLSGKIFLRQGGTCYGSQCTKLEVSRFTRCEAMNGGAKYRKWGGCGALKVMGNVTIR